MNEPQQQPRPFTWMLAFVWLVTCAAVVLLWTMGRLFTPREVEFVAVLAIALAGGACVFCNGVMWLRSSSKGVPVANVGFGVGVWIAVGMFVFMLLSSEEGPIPVFGTVDAPRAPVTKIRLYNLNVLHGYPDFFEQNARFRKTVDEIRSREPDIVVLQEAWNTTDHGSMAEQLAKELGFNYVFARANGSRALIGFEEGAAVLSRFPIVEAKSILLRPRKPWWENRIALAAKLDVGGEQLKVAGVHLSVLFPHEQGQFLMEISPQFSPDIITGDLNAEPGSHAVMCLAKNNYVEAIPDSTIHAKGNMEFSLKDWSKPAIDHSFLSRDFLTRWSVKETSCIVTSHLSYPCQPRDAHRYAISDHEAIMIDLVRR